MKYCVAVLLLAVLWSCQNEPAKVNSTDAIARKDSGILKAEAANPYVQIDVSPMDMAYFPADYPVKKMNDSTAASPVMRIIYSRPHRQGRKIFGELVKWGQAWRLGANEASEIEFFQPVTVQNKKVEKGRYVVYAIPSQDKWTIVFNTKLFSWGLKFDSTKDILKFNIPIAKKPQTVEYFSIVFDKTSTGADMVMAWENIEARLPIQF